MTAGIASALGADFAFIGEIRPDQPNSVSVVSVTAGGGPAERFSYELNGTPCADAIENEVCVHPHSVYSIYPNDELLQTMGIQGYAGVPLRGPEGHPIGLLVAMHCSPIADTELWRGLLVLLAPLAASELNRGPMRAALARSEASFRRVIEQSPDGVLIYRYGRIAWANPAFLSLFNISDPIGRPVDGFFTQETLDSARTAEGQQQPHHVHGLERHDGRKLWLELTNVGIDFQGEPSELLLVRDVSMRRELTMRMMRLDRMSAVGTLAAGVGHEINNPLTYVLNNVEMALERIDTMFPMAQQHPNPADLRAELQEVHGLLSEVWAGADRVRRVASELLLFGRQGPTGETARPLDEPVRSALNMARNELRHKARIEIDLQPTPPVRGDPAKLGQIALNLLINASQAVGRGGRDQHTVYVKTGPKETGGFLQVCDDGPGVPPALRERIFEPFFTTKAPGEGTGLGLAIARQIAESAGGTLRLDTSDGRSSCFRLELPRVAAPPSAVSPSPSPPHRAATQQGQRVFVIDDDPAICRVIHRMLHKQHHVRVEGDPRAALEHLRDAPRYDIILCDVMMPGMSGIELYASLRELAPEQADVLTFMTGGAFGTGVRAGLEAAGRPKLRKPFRRTDLLALLHHKD